MGKRATIPKEQIRWIVTRRYNVTVPDATVRDDFIREIATKSKDKRWTPRRIKAAAEYAVKCHARNRALFYKIAGGGIG